MRGRRQFVLAVAQGTSLLSLTRVNGWVLAMFWRIRKNVSIFVK